MNSFSVVPRAAVAALTSRKRGVGSSIVVRTHKYAHNFAKNQGTVEKRKIKNAERKMSGLGVANCVRVLCFSVSRASWPSGFRSAGLWPNSAFKFAIGRRGDLTRRTPAQTYSAFRSQVSSLFVPPCQPLFVNFVTEAKAVCTEGISGRFYRIRVARLPRFKVFFPATFVWLGIFTYCCQW
jgi:hypothetical protein